MNSPRYAFPSPAITRSPDHPITDIMPLLLTFLIALALAGCQGAADLAGPGLRAETGLRGVVVRGPMQPVCQEGESCDDAPFAATFYVYAGARRIATFHSSDDGRFEIALDPGPYTVVPGPNAPIMTPESQRQEVLVAPYGMTDVVLAFDTGIR
jgi:hypothetical protein